MFSRMTNMLLHQPSIELLLSLGALPKPFGAYALPLETWLKQRETIASTQAGVGARRKPLLLVTFSCARCGVIGDRPAYEVRKKIKARGVILYCGLTCSTRANNSARGMVDHRTCNGCTALMEPNRRSKLYCSPACYTTAIQIRGVKSRNPALDRVCGYCRIPFRARTLSQPVRAPGRFCSRACKNKGQAQDVAGINNPGWRNGINTTRGLSKAWYAAKQLVWNRDRCRCVVCGENDRLDVHHINMIPSDHRLENLVALCRGCHRKFHAAERSKPSRILWPWLSAYAEAKPSMT